MQLEILFAGDTASSTLQIYLVILYGSLSEMFFDDVQLFNNKSYNS